MLLIGNNLVVSMHYDLIDDNGNKLDSSKEGGPLTFLHGAGNIIPGLEKALTGKVQGNTCKVRVEPAEAYGEVIPEMIRTLDKSVFQGVETIEPGMAFEAKGPDGGTQRIVIKNVEGDNVTIDANHPLAGMALNFDVEIVGVREATKEEAEHGHVHDGHHHH